MRLSTQSIMKKLLLTLSILIYLAGFLQAQTTIAGSVTNENGETLIGANVVVESTTTGTSTDESGKFNLAIRQNPPLKIKVSYAGFVTKTIEVTQKATTLNITLQEGILLTDDIVVSASRKREKIQEAPASVSILSARAISVSPNVNPTQSLGNLAGVHIHKHSANRINIEMRGNMELFGTKVFPIMDYRNLISPGVDIFQSSGVGLSNIDLARIEVVRGPGSALYGPGVTVGVVHFITKNPIDHPGTTLEVQGGELNTFGVAARHATKMSDKFGFKINAHYNRGNEFTLDPNSADSTLIKTYSNQLTLPAITNGAVDIGKPGTVINDNLDEDGDGNPIANNYYNATINTTLEFRPQDDLSVFVSGGFNSFNEVYYNNQGPGWSHNQEFWTQARVQYKGLFAQTFYIDAGAPADKPSFLYGTGVASGIDRANWETQIQYNFNLPSILNADITVGADTRRTTSDSQNRTYGRNEDIDDYNISGVYAQGKFKATEKLDFLLAGRYDETNVLDKGLFSPRVALVYKANEKNTVRATFNRAGVPPSALTTYLDLPIGQPIPNQFLLWAYGATNTTSYQDQNMIDLTPIGLPDIPIGSAGLPLEVVYNAINSAAMANINLGNDPYQIATFLNGYMPNGTTGTLEGFNISNGVPLEAVEQQPVEVRIFDTYELGYNGLVADKLKVMVDVYYNRVKGFTKFTAIGPTYRLSDADVSGDLSNTLESDLIDYLMNQGLSQADAAAEAAPVLAAYGTESTTLNSQISPFFGLFGAAEGDVVPQDPNIVYLPFGYRSFPDAIDYFGADIGLTYYVNNDLYTYFNYSWQSQNEWIPGEANDDGLEFQFFSNTPRNKFRLGAIYAPSNKWFGSLAFQHTPSYNIDLGLYSGATDVQNIVDASIGYGFENGLKISLTGTNIFNLQYRALPSMPIIGRRILAKAVYDF